MNLWKKENIQCRIQCRIIVILEICRCDLWKCAALLVYTQPLRMASRIPVDQCWFHIIPVFKWSLFTSAAHVTWLEWHLQTVLRNPCNLCSLVATVLGWFAPGQGDE